MDTLVREKVVQPPSLKLSQAMRKRSVLVLVCLVTVAVACFWALWLAWPEEWIKREQLGRIRPGMTVEDVETILGKPTGSYPNDVAIMIVGVPESSGDFDRLFMDPGGRQWVGKETAIVVAFDERARVTATYFGYLSRQQEGFLTIVRRWFGL
jgi:SmpA / OmlA family